MAATKMGGDSTATILQIKSEEELIRIGPQLLQAVEVGVGSQEKLPNPPIFHSNDLVVGPVVGQGGYCIVKAVTKLGKNGTIVDNVAAVDTQRVEGDCVVKCLKPTADETTGLNSKVVSLSQATVRGRVDLAIEAKILGMLQHPHIVSLRGLARVPSPLDSGFFIVMDRLYESLEDKIQKGWKQRFVMEALDAHIPGLPWNHRGLMDLQRERLRLLHDVATAFQYLHRKRYVCAPKTTWSCQSRTHARPLQWTNRILYRDIKPENVAFDAKGRAKVFDFGLAKVLREGFVATAAAPESDGTETLYNLTPRTGSFPYMAPEVARQRPYNEKCDIFSFGMLMWETMALELAFLDAESRKEMYSRIVGRNERPPIGYVQDWPQQVIELVTRCWNADSERRPDFNTVVAVLDSELQKASQVPD